MLIVDCISVGHPITLSLLCGEQKTHNPPTMKTLIKIPIPSLLIALMLALACIIGLSPNAHAVSPAPDGGYPGFNTAEGSNALFSLTTGIWNTALGGQALFHDTTGSNNTAVGLNALYFNIGGLDNTATGAQALLHNTGNYNTATGFQALENNTGTRNTAIGVNALFSNISDDNTAIGVNALFSNTQGFENTAVGSQALESDTLDGFNTAIGFQALQNTTGGSNTAVGHQTLQSTSTGGGNTAIGLAALYRNTTGVGNIAVGQGAGENVTTANNVICIGALGNNAGNSCYIGNIFGATSSSGVGVFVNSNGRLGTMTSSRRFKEEIKPMEDASETLFLLKPVSFRYKKGIDPENLERKRQFGLVAEDVEKANPDLVVRDKEGKPYSVRYDAVNAMLLNEFLKEHRKVEELEAAVSRQHKDFETAVAELKEQIQKVSAQLELSKTAAQTVLNSQ
jgi:hypothetical protein